MIFFCLTALLLQTASPAPADAAPVSPAAIPSSPFGKEIAAPAQDIRLAVSSFVSARDGRFSLVLNSKVGDKGTAEQIILSKLGKFKIRTPDGMQEFELLRADVSEIVVRGPDGSVYNFL
ncbi:MAG: hypothetical protein RL095_3000 [Verrucomicrobiota bacterium]|jgi:hypothetical protein